MYCLEKFQRELAYFLDIDLRDLPKVQEILKAQGYTAVKKNDEIIELGSARQSFLEKIPADIAPSTFTKQEIEKLLTQFDNIENLTQHLNTRADSQARQELFHLLESTKNNPNIHYTKDSKDKYLKRFKDNDEHDPYFYLLITKDKDKTFITHLKTRDLNYLEKEILNAESIIKGADIIGDFRQQAGSAKHKSPTSTTHSTTNNLKWQQDGNVLRSVVELDNGEKLLLSKDRLENVYIQSNFKEQINSYDELMLQESLEKFAKDELENKLARQIETKPLAQEVDSVILSGSEKSHSKKDTSVKPQYDKGEEQGYDKGQGYDKQKIDSSVKVEPINEFGENYPQFYHKPHEAIKHLLETKSGQVQGAFYRDELGDITLAWGEKGTGKSDGWGLAKIVEYHPEVIDKLDELVQNLPIVKENANRYQLENDMYKLSIRKDFEGQKENWILTAFEKDESIARRRTDLPSSQSEAEKTTSANAKDIIPQTTKEQGKSVAETKELIRKNKELESAPINEFGENYPQFYHKPHEAIKHLLETKSGQVQGAFYRDELGDIDLVWGNEKIGLQKIVDKHLNDFTNFAGNNPYEKMSNAINEIIENGKLLAENGVNTLYLQKDNKTFLVGLSKGWHDKGENQWIITSYEAKNLKADMLEKIGANKTISADESLNALQTFNATDDKAPMSAYPHQNKLTDSTSSPIVESALTKDIIPQKRNKAGIAKLDSTQIQSQIQKEAQAQEAMAESMAQTQAKRDELIAQKEARLGKNADEVPLDKGQDIAYKPIRDTSIVLNDESIPFEAEFAVVKLSDIKPNFDNSNTQGRLIKQESVIANIVNDFKPELMFYQEGGVNGVPIITRDGKVVSGNHRSEALKEIFNAQTHNAETAREAYKKNAKDFLGVDLQDNEIIVRRLKENMSDKQILQLAFSSNIGRESTMGEKALSTLSLYRQNIATLPKVLQSENVNELKSLVAKHIDKQGNGLNTFEPNLALLTSLARNGKNSNILQSLDSIKGNSEYKNKIINMYVDNAGSFYNLAHNPSFKNLEFRDILSDAMYYTARQNPTREVDYTHLISDIESFLNIAKDKEALKNALVLDSNKIENLTAQAFGLALAKFSRQENPSSALYEALKEAPKALELATQPTFFTQGKALSEIDIYDFLEYLINQGQVTQSQSVLSSLMPRLRELRESIANPQSSVSKVESSIEATSQISKEIKDIIDSSPQKGRDMQIIGEANFTPQVVEYAHKNNKKVAIDKLSQAEAEQLGYKYPNDVRVTIDYSAINHTLNRHGAESALVKNSGQKAVDYDLIAEYRSIVKGADETLNSVDNMGTPVVVSYKQINGHFVVVEEIRKGQNELNFKTMFKQDGNYKDSESYKKTSQSSNATEGYEPTANSFASTNDIIPQNPQEIIKQAKVVKSERVLSRAENFQGISNTAAPLPKQTSLERSSDIIPQTTQTKHEYSELLPELEKYNAIAKEMKAKGDTTLTGSKEAFKAREILEALQEVISQTPQAKARAEQIAKEITQAYNDKLRTKINVYHKMPEKTQKQTEAKQARAKEINAIREEILAPYRDEFEKFGWKAHDQLLVYPQWIYKDGKEIMLPIADDAKVLIGTHNEIYKLAPTLEKYARENPHNKGYANKLEIFKDHEAQYAQKIAEQEKIVQEYFSHQGHNASTTTPPQKGLFDEADSNDIVFTDKKGKEHTLTKEVQQQWLETFNLKSINESYIPKHSDEIREALGGKEIKLQLGSLKKLVAQGREKYIPQIKEVLDSPEVIMRDDMGEYLFIKHLKDDDYFVNVSFDNGEYLVSISNGIKETRNLNNKLEKGGSFIYQSPNFNSISQKLLQTSQYSANKIDSDIIPQTTQEIIKQAKQSGKSVAETKELIRKNKELESARQKFNYDEYANKIHKDLLESGRSSD